MNSGTDTIRPASEPGVGLAGCEGALKPAPPPTPTPGGLLCWSFWGGGPGVGLALCCFVVYSTRRYVLLLTLCHFVLVFSVLGKERANLSAFRTFVRFVLLWIGFPLPFGVWEGLRFVIVALPGLFSYLFSTSSKFFTIYLSLIIFRVK